MDCPKCGFALPEFILEREYGFEGVCPKCDGRISKETIRSHMTAEDCPLVRKGEKQAEDFDSDDCLGCDFNCIFAPSTLEEFGMTQDEEGNWVYPEDLMEQDEEGKWVYPEDLMEQDEEGKWVYPEDLMEQDEKGNWIDPEK